MKTFQFCLVAFDETDAWDELPVECTRAEGIYIMRVGEASYCASITPVSYCMFLCNEFYPHDNDSVQNFAAYTGRWDGVAMYTPYVDPARIPERCVFEIEVDETQFDTDDEVCDEAWELAEASSHANPTDYWYPRK